MNWTYNDLPTTNAEVREELRIKTLLAPYVEPLMKRIADLQNENRLLYHQRDQWMKRAKDPKGAWSAFVDGANWLVILRQRLLRRIHKLESHGSQHIDQCCFCGHAEENEIT